MWDVKLRKVVTRNMIIFKTYLSGQICSLRVAGGDGSMIPQQQIMHGCTNNLTATNHHSSFPCHRHTCREDDIVPFSPHPLVCLSFVWFYSKNYSSESFLHCCNLSVWSAPCSHLVCKGWNSRPDLHEKASLRLCWSACAGDRKYWSYHIFSLNQK